MIEIHLQDGTEFMIAVKHIVVVVPHIVGAQLVLPDTLTYTVKESYEQVKQLMLWADENLTVQFWRA